MYECAYQSRNTGRQPQKDYTGSAVRGCQQLSHKGPQTYRAAILHTATAGLKGALFRCHSQSEVAQSLP